MNHLKTICQLAALWGAATLAATVWAAGITEEGYILEPRDWRGEVAGVPSPDWPVDGWYRVSPGRQGVDVRAMKPATAEDGDPEGALFVRVPGARIVEGMRPRVRFAAGEFRPRVQAEYNFALGKVPFTFIVQSDRDGTRYDISYAGATHSYMLGLPAAATRIKAIADFDGDALPDFLVEVGDDTFLLLSTQARPGGNVPSAQLWAMGN
ncbi:MAG TPA: hypothetical protein VMZ74_01195 [Ramlibacter sp.]|nr:hypothetical protein [Ramlibacter sp.]